MSIILPGSKTANDLYLPGTVRAELKAAGMLPWLELVTKILDVGKVKWRLVDDEMGIALQQHLKGRLSKWLVFDVLEGSGVPADVWLLNVNQWLEGAMQPMHVYRLLSPAEQIRVSNQTGRKPGKPQVSDGLSKVMQLRDSARKQGFDPDKEKL